MVRMPKRKLSATAARSAKRGRVAQTARTLFRALVKKRRAKFVKRIPKAAMMPEQKLTALVQLNERSIVPIQVGAQAAGRGFVIGAKPASWSGTWDNLSGVTIPQGTQPYQRNGQYVYLRHSNVFFNVESNCTAVSSPPMEMRVIVFKARRETSPAGVSYNPNESLFLDDVGTPTGAGISGFNGYDLTRRMVNRRDWIIHTDRRFILARPLVNDSDGGGVVGYTGKYPVSKNMQFKLPYNKKTRYNSSNLPEDCSYHWGIVVYARSIAKDTACADQAEINIRGNTVYLDP